MEHLGFKGLLKESLYNSFIDRNIGRDFRYAPKVLINNPEEKRFVLTDLQDELSQSKAFYFSVAFVTKSGLALIKTQLSDLAEKNISGKIIISPYLDFNSPDTLRELLKINNIDVRITPKELQSHSKYYLFDQGYKQVLISGSSNLTDSALKKNYEWNIKLTSASDGEIVFRTKEEFNRIWDLSLPLTEKIIEEYANQRKVMQVIQQPTEESKKIKANPMQEKALNSLENIRNNGASKALVISATGTGKTYLAALDVKNYNPKKMLFLVHREQILAKALESFKNVIDFDDNQAMIYKAGASIDNKKYVFATIQTLSRDEHLQKFDKDEFDYILIDEVHKAGADSYKKVISYFEPEFLLGMTATPERTDGQNIYELFDYNVAYEIRLQEALDSELLCPFIYYGVTDISLNGELLDENTSFDKLISEERVKHIINKIDYYGHSGSKVKGLIFCSRKEEAYSLSNELNKNGYKTAPLSGDDSQKKREEVVSALENGELEYILTVDIFNEGIDIPSVNQVVMLRNTQSSIVFIQQLGRGLRKHNSKEYVTIIDFIGNYKNNYMIPIALFGDNSMNKENYKRSMSTSSPLTGLTTVNFEEVARKHILKSITNTTLSSIKNLHDAFITLKNRLGRTPYLLDFIKSESLDVSVFFENNSFRNYADVINKFSKEESDKIILSEIENKYLSFITFEILNSKRKHELILLKELLSSPAGLKKESYLDILEKENLSNDDITLSSIEAVLSLRFLKQTEVKKFGETPLVHLDKDIYYLNKEVKQSLEKSEDFKKLFFDVIESAFIKVELYPEILTIGKKYTRREILKLLNFVKDEPSLNIGGYKINKFGNNCPVFVKYHKSEEISDTIKYDNKFLSENILEYYSKNKRTLDSPDVLEMMNTNETGLKLELFVIKDDSEGVEYYYLGSMKYLENTAEELLIAGNSVVKMTFKLETPVEKNLYDYLTIK